MLRIEGTNKFSDALKVFDAEEEQAVQEVLKDVKLALQEEFVTHKLKMGKAEAAITFVTEILEDTPEPAWFLCARSRYFSRLSYLEWI